MSWHIGLYPFVFRAVSGYPDWKMVVPLIPHPPSQITHRAFAAVQPFQTNS